jgi:hypothetical protein
MNASAHPEVPREPDQVKEHGGKRGLDTVAQEDFFTEQPWPPSPAGPYIPDKGAFETFIAGAGI